MCRLKTLPPVILPTMADNVVVIGAAGSVASALADGLGAVLGGHDTLSASDVDSVVITVGTEPAPRLQNTATLSSAEWDLQVGESMWDALVTLQMAHAALESIRLLTGGTKAFTERCLEGLEANPEACEAAVEKSLALATALNPYVGYERAAALAKEAFKTGKTIRQLCEEKKILPKDQLDEALDPWRMTKPQ